MQQVTNKALSLCCEEDGSGLILLDRQRDVRWRLDEKSLVYGTGGDLRQCDALRPVAAHVGGEDALVVVLRAGERELEMRYHLRADHVEVRLPPPAAADIRCVSMPGSFTPEGEVPQLLIPIMQGMLWDGRGEPFEAIHGESGHTGFSMPFVGYLATRGGLLTVAETRDDVHWWLGKDG